MKKKKKTNNDVEKYKHPFASIIFNLFFLSRNVKIIKFVNIFLLLLSYKSSFNLEKFLKSLIYNKIKYFCKITMKHSKVESYFIY